MWSTIFRPALLFPRIATKIPSVNPSRFFHCSRIPFDKEDTLYSIVKLPQCTEKQEDLALHAIWLRDHCPCPECYHSITHQRLLETDKIPATLKAEKVKNLGDTIEIQWHDGHRSIFRKSWLSKHAYSSVAKKRPLNLPIPLQYWDQSIQKNPPTLSFKDVFFTEKSLYDLLYLIFSYGFAFVKDVPSTLSASQELSERISFIRETHYGRYWDFTSDLSHNDTAYTTLALPLHTDTTYFTDPIRLQIFHLLEFQGTGGETILQDGFRVARALQHEVPDAYATLTSTHISSHTDPHMFPLLRYPILSETAEGELHQIRYNNNDRSVLDHLSAREVELFYRGLRAWQQRLVSPYTFAMSPGTVLVLDNWRVMHGRTAFTGHRRLTGCYLNNDDVCSRFRGLYHKYHPKARG